MGRTSAPSDTDLDGMPDKWETKYDLDPGNALDAGGDNDGDGYANVGEAFPNDPTQHADTDGDGYCLLYTSDAADE